MPTNKTSAKTIEFVDCCSSCKHFQEILSFPNPSRACMERIETFIDARGIERFFHRDVEHYNICNHFKSKGIF